MFQNKDREGLPAHHRTGPKATLWGCAVRSSGRPAQRAAVMSAAIVLVAGCSGNSGAPVAAGWPAVTTISLTLNGEAVNLAGLSQKCYDYQGHLTLEAYNPANSSSSSFLMDYYNNGVSLSIGIQGGSPGSYDFQAGQNGQNAAVTRHGNSVSVSGKIGVALDDTAPLAPFSIQAECAKFFNTPPDSSYVGTPTPGLNTVTTAPALAAPAAADVVGTWKGTYNCGQGATGMTLRLTQAADGTLDADFTFYAVATNPTVASGSGTLHGTYVAGDLSLTWQSFTRNPAGYIGVDFNGVLSGSGAAQRLQGNVIALPGGEPCTTFSLTRG